MALNKNVTSLLLLQKDPSGHCMEYQLGARRKETNKMTFAVIQVSDKDDPVSQCAWSILGDIEDEEVIADLVMIGCGG